jgi:hypothetical protein
MGIFRDGIQTPESEQSSGNTGKVREGFICEHLPPAGLAIEYRQTAHLRRAQQGSGYRVAMQAGRHEFDFQLAIFADAGALRQSSGADFVAGVAGQHVEEAVQFLRVGNSVEAADPLATKRMWRNEWTNNLDGLPGPSHTGFHQETPTAVARWGDGAVR